MKSNSQFKTMRHIETVRNFLNAATKELISRGEQHDQSKLQEPEISVFNEYTPKLRGLTYGSDEYIKNTKAMGLAIKHHQKHNKHHPEYFENGIQGMNLIDLLEMLIDWKAAGLRHADGDIYKSLEINKKRFNMSEEVYNILKNTIDWIQTTDVKHHAEES